MIMMISHYRRTSIACITNIYSMTRPTNLAEIGDKVGDRRGGLVIEAVKRHDGLLPDALLGVPKQLHHLWQHRRNGLLVNEPAHGVERGAHHQIIV